MLVIHRVERVGGSARSFPDLALGGGGGSGMEVWSSWNYHMSLVETHHGHTIVDF